MAFTGSALCNSFKQELFQGTHTDSDTYKIALYTNSASLTKATTAYTSSGEVADGGGYSAGGIALTKQAGGAGWTIALTSDTASADFADPVWSNATITARGALIYNSSKSNKAVAVIDFGSDIVSTNGDFTVQIPSSGTGLIRVT